MNRNMSFLLISIMLRLLLRYYNIIYCTELNCTVLYCTVLYCTVLYCTVLYCTVLYCTILYSVLYLPEHDHSLSEISSCTRVKPTQVDISDTILRIS